MPRLKPKKRTKPTNRREAPRPSEQHAVEVATVAWMLTAMVALAGEVSGIAALLLLSQGTGLADEAGNASVLPSLLFLCASVAGVVCLVLTPYILRARRTPPPREITIAAVIVAAAPLVTIFVWQLTA